MAHDDDLERIIAAQPYPPGKNGNGRWKIDPRLGVSILGWIVSILLAWGAFNTRLSVVEIQQQENERRMQRLEEKIDLLLRRP